MDFEYINTTDLLNCINDSSANHPHNPHNRNDLHNNTDFVSTVDLELVYYY